MFFSKQQPRNQRAATYIHEVATLATNINFGTGRAIMLDKTIWRVFCPVDCTANTKVKVVNIIDKMTLQVIPI